MNIYFLECPSGTYKPDRDPGDRRSCLPCPGDHMVSPAGSYSALQCHCTDGYSFNEKTGKCELMDCPALQPPDNGYFIRNECKNVFNAACGVRCNSGYQVSDNVLTHMS